MIRTRFVASTLALSCALAATSAWADAGNTPIDSPVRDNDTTSRQIATELLQEVAPGPFGLRVQARHGQVRLSGSVASIRDWTRAEQIARSSAGDAEIQNDLSVLIR
jgi:osmotically-inducible protein OsmY